MATTWNNLVGDGLWSTAGNWTSGAAPAAGEAVTFNGTSVANCNIDNVGAWSGSGGTITIAIAYTGVITANVAFSVTNLVMSAGGGSATFTDNSGITCSNTFTINNGHTYNAYSGTTVISRNFTVTASAVFNHNSGTISFSGFAGGIVYSCGDVLNAVIINSSSFLLSSGVLNLGANPSIDTTGNFSWAGSATLKGTGTLTSNVGGTLSVNLATSVVSGFTAIVFNNSSWSASAAATIPALNMTFNITTAATKLFTGSGRTYGTFTRTGAGTGQITFIGSNTFTTFTDNDGLSSHTLSFTAGTTTTVSSFLVAGTASTTVSIISTAGGSAATLHTTGGQVQCHWMSIKDSTADASPVWDAGSESTNVSGNTNWFFNNAPPSSAPNAPTNLAAVAGNAQVSLSWTASTGSPTSYSVKRGTTPGTEVLLQTLGLVTSYLDTAVINGTTYYYVVTASNAGGESGNSNEVSATPIAPTTSSGGGGNALHYLRRVFGDEDKRRHEEAKALLKKNRDEKDIREIIELEEFI